MESPQPFRLTVNRFYYPGWRAWVDGEPVEAVPESERGRLTFPVPAGKHHVAVRFGEMPLRLAADVLSGLSLLALAGVVLLPSLLQRRGRGAGARSEAGVGLPSAAAPVEVREERAQGWLVVLSLAVTAAVLLVERLQLPPVYARRLTDGGIGGVARPACIVYDSQFHLLGWDAIPSAVPADRPVPVRLYWFLSFRGWFWRFSRPRFERAKLQGRGGMGVWGRRRRRPDPLLPLFSPASGKKGIRGDEGGKMGPPGGEGRQLRAARMPRTAAQNRICTVNAPPQSRYAARRLIPVEQTAQDAVYGQHNESNQWDEKICPRTPRRSGEPRASKWSGSRGAGVGNGSRASPSAPATPPIRLPA